MIRSLRRVDPDCRISVLCLTPACERVLARLHEPGVTWTTLADFERENPDLLAIKDDRSLRDYYFTLSGCTVSSALEAAVPGDIVTYLDADLMFYSSPAPIFEAIANASIGLVGHRYHWWAKRLEKYGRFNVGWVSFRADATGLEAARWWRNSCIEWCYGCVDGDRFADQKYLDHIFRKFPNVIEVTHPGANVGPWNICRHTIVPGPAGHIRGRRKIPADLLSLRRIEGDRAGRLSRQQHLLPRAFFHHGPERHLRTLCGAPETNPRGDRRHSGHHISDAGTLHRRATVVHEPAVGADTSQGQQMGRALRQVTVRLTITSGCSKG